VLNTNIPLPTSTRRSQQNYSIKDVVKAFDTILKFTRFKEKIDKLVNYLASMGVNIDISSFSNPNMLIKQLMNLKKSGYNIDVDEIITELNNLEDIKLDEIERSIDIIRTFISISRSVSTIMSSLSKTALTTREDLDMLRSLFNIGKPIEDKVEDDYSEKLSEEEIRKIREEAKKMLLGV